MFQLLNNINILLSYLLSKSRYRYLYALLKGLGLALTLPCFTHDGFAFMAIFAWLGLVPIIVLAKSSRSTIQLSVETLIFFMAYHLVAFAWLPSLHPLNWQGFSTQESIVTCTLAWILPSLFHSFLALPFTLTISHMIKSRNQGHKKYGSLSIQDIVVLSAIWVAIQYKLQFNLGPLSIFSVPLHLLAYSQYQFSYLIQITNTVGTLGLEFLIVIFNLFASNFFKVQVLDSSKPVHFHSYNIKQPSFSLYNLNEQAILGTCLAIILSYSLFFGYKQIHDQEELRPISFGAISVGLSAESSRGKNLNDSEVITLMHNQSINLSEKTSTLSLYPNNKAEILAWPEGSVPRVIKDSVSEDLTVLSELTQLFIFGTYHEDEQNKIYNSIAYLDYTEQGQVLSFYNKINLVPFGEYTPLLEILPSNLKELAVSSIGSGFDRGSPKQMPIKTSAGIIGSSICFELLFPDLVREQVNHGAELLVNLNDLSWFHLATIQDAFLAVATMRAVENNKSLILVSNVGKSLSINAYGQATAPELRRSKSIYTQYGW